MGSQVRVSAGSPLEGGLGCYIDVRYCGRLSMVFLQLKEPMELLLKKRVFPPGSRYLSCCDMT